MTLTYILQIHRFERFWVFTSTVRRCPAPRQVPFERPMEETPLGDEAGIDPVMTVRSCTARRSRLLSYSSCCPTRVQFGKHIQNAREIPSGADEKPAMLAQQTQQ